MIAQVLHAVGLWLWSRTMTHGLIFRLGRTLHSAAWRRGYRCNCLPF